MSKKIVKIIKLQITAGKANPAPPIGPALGAAGVNIPMFCKNFNAETQGKSGVLPTVITVYHDKTYSFVTKEPPVADQIKKELGIEKGSAVPNRDKVGKLNRAQAERIARQKMQDMNIASATDIDAAVKIVASTARSMGIDYIG